MASGDLFDVGFVRKGLTMLALEGDFRRAIRRTWPSIRFDLVLYPTPPVTFVGLVEELKRKQGCATYLILRDIFPQNAVDVGVMRKGLAYHYFRRVERRLYAVSDRIGCMSPANVDWVVRDGVPRAKARAAPQLAPPARAAAPAAGTCAGNGASRASSSRSSAGCIGVAQELEFLLELAHDCRDRHGPGLRRGGGGEPKAALREMAARLRLPNVRFRGPGRPATTSRGCFARPTSGS